ncbi:unnamed protein product [Sphagnum balticum]
MENRDRDFLPVEDHANEAAAAAAGLRVGADDLDLASPDSSLVSVILPVVAPGPALPISWEWTPPSIPPRSIVTPGRAVATLMQLSGAPPLNAGDFSTEVVLDASLSHTATTNVVQWPRRRISCRDLHRIARRNRIRALKATQWPPGTQCPDAPASSSTSQRYGDLTSRRDWYFAFRHRDSTRPIRHLVNNQLQRPDANYIYRSSRPMDQPRIVTPQQHQSEDPARQQRDQQHYINWHWSRRFPHPTWAQSLPDSWQHAEWQPQRQHHDVELRREPGAVPEAGWSMFGMRQRHHHVILVESGWNTPQHHLLEESGWNTPQHHLLEESGWNTPQHHLLVESGWNAPQHHLLEESEWDRPQPVQQPASWPPLESDSAAAVADSQDEVPADQASDGELGSVHNDDP